MTITKDGPFLWKVPVPNKPLKLSDYWVSEDAPIRQGPLETVVYWAVYSETLRGVQIIAPAGPG